MSRDTWLPKSGAPSRIGPSLHLRSDSCLCASLLSMFYHHRHSCPHTVKGPKGCTPQTSYSQSPRFSFQSVVAEPEIEQLLEKSSYTQAELRRLLLKRDNYRCAVSGFIDYVTVRNNPTAASRTTGRAFLEVAHIISQSLTEGVNGASPAAEKKFEWAADASAIIERFGSISLRKILGDACLNNPYNAFMVSPFFHSLFDELRMWFAPVKVNDVVVAHTYEIKALDNSDLCDALPRVIFTPTQVESGVIEAPHPSLIALHAACANIAHMSRAAEYIERFDRDIDDLPDMTAVNAPAELTRALTSPACYWSWIKDHYCTIDCCPVVLVT